MPFLVELRAPRDVAVREFDLPDLGTGEVLVATSYSGISAGTELTQYRGTNAYLHKRWDAERQVFAPSEPNYPYDAWGYSEVGRVEAVGAGVIDGVGDGNVAVGDLVWGIWHHRSHAVLPATSLAGHRLPPGLPPLVGTFDRVGAVALNAVFAAQPVIGETAAVFGQGVIGLLATQLLVGMGVRVLAVDRVAHRLDLAQRFGAVPVRADDAVAESIRVLTGGAGVDRVIELTGSYAALQDAVRVAGDGGTVIAAGLFQGPGSELMLDEEFHHNRVTVQACQIGGLPRPLRDRWSRERLHATVIRLCADGRLDPAPLVSQVIPAREAARAYALVDRPPEDLVQVVLDFTDGSPA